MCRGWIACQQRRLSDIQCVVESLVGIVCLNLQEKNRYLPTELPRSILQTKYEIPLLNTVIRLCMSAHSHWLEMPSSQEIGFRWVAGYVDRGAISQLVAIL